MTQRELFEALLAGHTIGIEELPKVEIKMDGDTAYVYYPDGYISILSSLIATSYKMYIKDI